MMNCDFSAQSLMLLEGKIVDPNTNDGLIIA